MTGSISYPIRVLFLCTENAGRSQLAEALLRSKGGDRFIVASAGTTPAREIHPEAIKVLGELGIDSSAQHPKGLEVVAHQRWDFVITLCDRSREACASLAGQPVFAHWAIPDPAEYQNPRRRALAFKDALNLLAWRLDLMLALRLDAFERLVMEQRLRAIGMRSPSGSSNRQGETRAPLS